MKINVTLILLLVAASARAGVWCTSCKGEFKISKEYRMVARSALEEDGLRSYLSKEPETTGERFLLLTADASLYERFTRDRVRLAPSGGPWSSPIQTEAPLAYFYDVGGNAFCQFRDRTKKVRWMVLRGRNLFLPSEVDRFSLVFVGQALVMTAGEPCESAHRVLEFTVSRIDKSALLMAARELAADLPLPHNLTIHFSSDLDHSIQTSDLTFPSLDLLDLFREKRTPDEVLNMQEPPPVDVESGLSSTDSLRFIRMESGLIRVVMYDGRTKESRTEDFSWDPGSPCKVKSLE
ncbi:MAG: hypothetical protein EHM61_08515 [Acidobacteria bacterium]|nr:MAG: hypothetical protein EHM61_08515 [Acidobacteriota bacterium]